MANIGVGYNTSNSLVTGTVYADKIYNGGRANTIIAGDGNDTIESVVHAYPYRYGYNSSIVAGAGNDSIVSNGNNATIDGGTGNDYIKNYYYSSLYTFLGEGSKVSLYGGAGNDTIENEGKNATIRGGTGNDSIKNKGLSTTFQYAAGDGRDTISGFNSSSTLQVLSSGVKVKSAISDGTNITLNVGSDSIILQECTNSVVVAKYANGQRESVSVSYNVNTSSWGSTPKNIVIGNNTHRSFSRGSNGNDTILNAGKYNTIEAGNGDDSINSHVVDTFLYGTDYIYRAGSYASINAGAGNDIVSLSSYNNYNVIQYANGDGNDKIYNLGSTDTLTITSGSYSSMPSGSDIILTVGSGKITLVGARYKSLNIRGTKVNPTPTPTPTPSNKGQYYSNSNSNRAITATSGADTLYNYGSYVKMDGGSGNDQLTSFSNGSRVTLTGGSGNDTIKSWSAYSRIDGGDGADYLYAGANYSTILGGAGNDSVINYGSYNSILGEAGSDTIENTSIGNYSTLNGGEGNDILKAGGASKDTLIGGKGNDSLWGGSGADTFIYSSGDGNDVIYGFANNDLLQITGAFSASYSKSKGEVYFNVGSSKITLKNYTTTAFHVNNKTYTLK